MYEVPASSVLRDLFELAGGAAPLIKRAKEHSDKGELVQSLHLLEIVLNTEPHNHDALNARINVYKGLLERSVNVIEQGWLKHGLRQDEQALKKSESGAK